MTADQAALLREAVAARKNILVAGGTGTGKTTLTNALLAEIAGTSDRVVLIEDTRELQCRAPNLVAMRTKDGVASLSDLVRSSLRLRPDRIPIGEVRGAEALDLLKAWGTGHPGGIGTIHAGTALGALRRLEQLIQEAVVTVPKALLAETIDLVAVLRGRGSERRLADRTDRVLQLVEGFMPEVGWLDDGETLTYLHSTVSTRQQRVRVPETPMHLDALLADEPLTGGLEPRLGRAHLRTLTVVGFPTATHPGILDELNRLAFPYRWSTRAACSTRPRR
jgi:Type II/IV secretion system protein